nr:zinc finger, RING/FYVE/PHD-type [Tanacetum cinerariifolium]
MMMMIIIMIAGIVDSIRTPIHAWLDKVLYSDDLQETTDITIKEVHIDSPRVDCIVCLSDVGLGEKHAMLERCKHGFHVVCVEAWLKDHPNCPLCRTPISGDDEDTHKHKMTKDKAGNEIEVPPVTAQQILKASAALINLMLLLVFLLLHAIVLRHKLDKEDLEQIDQDDLEEMDLKWQVVMLSMRVNQFYKKTRRKLEFNEKEPVGFDKNKFECFNCHRRGHFARDYKSPRNLGNRSRDAWNVGYKGRDNEKEATDFALMAFTSNPSSSSSSNSKLDEALKEKEDSKAILEKFETFSKNLTKLLDSQISAKVKTSLRYDNQFNEKEVLDIKDEEVSESVFDNRPSDEENSVANDRFKKGEGYHVVSPPLAGNYMPLKPNLSFVGLDDSIYKFNISETVTSLAKDEKDALETSISCVKKPKKDRMAKKSVLPTDVGKETGQRKSRPVWNNVQRINHQNKFAPTAVFIRSGRILVSAAKPKAATSTSAAKPINTARPKQSVKFSKTRSTFHKSYSPIRRSFYNATAHSIRNSAKRVNTARSKVVSVVKGNGVSAVKTSTGCVWRPRMNAIDQLSKDNRWICTRVDYGHPQQALKNKEIADNECSRHMTGNKAYLSDYQEIHDGGFVVLVQVEMSLSAAGFSLYCWMKLCTASTIIDAAELINSVKQIHTIVDEKAVVISESSVRSDLFFNDKDGHTTGSGEDRMEQETDLTDLVPPTPHDSPLSGGHTLGSDEGRPNLLELMNICTKLSNKVLALEEAKTTQDKDKNDDQTEELNLTNGADIEVIVKDKGSGEKGGSTTRLEVSAATLSTPLTTTTIFGDEDLTIAQTLIKMKSENAKEKGVSFIDVEEPPKLTRSTTTLQPLLTIDLKNKDLAQRIYEEELAELDRAQNERQKQEETIIAALTEEFDEIQARMDIDDFVPMDFENEEKKSVEPESKDQKGKRIKIVADSAPKQKSSKKQKMMQEPESAKSDEEESADYEQENEELRMWLTFVLDEEETVDPEFLSTKYPIVDWESQILGNVDMEDKHVYKIIRVNENTSYHRSLSSMLRKFDRQDLVDLHRLVMKRCEENTLESYNFLLWGDLKNSYIANGWYFELLQHVSREKVSFNQGNAGENVELEARS